MIDINVNEWSIALKQLCWNLICKMIALHYTSCHDVKNDFSLSYRTVSKLNLMPWPHLIIYLLNICTTFCYVLDAAFVFDCWKCFKSNTITKHCSLTHDRTLINSSLHRTLLASQWIPNLNRLPHLDRITRSPPSMGRKVDFTFDT